MLIAGFHVEEVSFNKVRVIQITIIQKEKDNGME